MCIMDLRVAQRLTPRYIRLTTPSSDYNAIPDFSRAYLIQVVSNTAINTIRARVGGNVLVSLPQRLDLAVQRESIGAGLIEPVYSREVIAAFSPGGLGVSDTAAEGSVDLIYWEMDVETMAELYGPLS